MDQAVLATDIKEGGEGAHGVVDTYLRFCARHLAQLEESIVKQDLASVSRIADMLRTNAGRVGLNELSSLGRQLEEYCFGRDWSAIDSTYRAIVDTVGKLCQGKRIEIGVTFERAGHVRVVNVEKGR